MRGGRRKIFFSLLYILYVKHIKIYKIIVNTNDNKCILHSEGKESQKPTCVTGQ
jgi:hypothetical protein